MRSRPRGRRAARPPCASPSCTTADVEPYGYAPEDAPGILRAVQAYHLGLSWTDIGYNFVVDRFGRTWEARGGGAATPVIGAHAYGFNTASMGVAVLGDFSAIGDNDPMADALAGLIAWKLYLSGSDPATPATVLARSTDRHEAGALLSLPRVVGHGDLNHTACPPDLRQLLDGLNGAVSARYRALDGATGTSAAPGPAALAGATPWPGDFDGDGRTPAHLADTRPAGATVDGVAVGAGARPRNGTYELTVAGRGGVPADASAVVLNVTATEGAGDGFVTVWPCGRPLPLALNLNYRAGTTPRT